MTYEVKQQSKSRWVVTEDGKVRSKHSSEKDAVRSMGNYIKRDADQRVADIKSGKIKEGPKVLAERFNRS